MPQSHCGQIRKEILIVTGGFADLAPLKRHYAIQEFKRLSHGSEDNVHRPPFSDRGETVFIKAKHRSCVTIWYMAMLGEEYAGDPNDKR